MKEIYQTAQYLERKFRLIDLGIEKICYYLKITKDYELARGEHFVKPALTDYEDSI